MSLQPYLFFSGTCRDAMSHYQRVLGGRLDMMTMGELPEGEEPPPGSSDLIMHAALILDDGSYFMASDDPTGDGGGTTGVAVSITVPTADDASRIFAGLAEGGEITMPLGQTFFSESFGMCTDRFGVQWMVGVEADEQ